MDWLLNHIESEATVLKGAPLIFTFTWALGAILIWQLLDRFVYRERLNAKDDLLRTYKQQLAEKETAGGGKPGLQRTLTDQQRNIIRAHIVRSTSGEQPLSRYVEVLSMQVEDCRSYAGEIAVALNDAGIANGGPQDLHPHFWDFRTGIWVAGTNDLQPPTNQIVLEAFAKAGISATAAQFHIAGVFVIVGTRPR